MDKRKIRIKVSMAGLADPAHDQPEFGYDVGQVVAVHPEIARKWIASRLAEPVERDEPLTNTAALSVGEMDSRFLKSYAYALGARNRRLRVERMEAHDRELGLRPAFWA